MSFNTNRSINMYKMHQSMEPYTIMEKSWIYDRKSKSICLTVQ